MKGTTQVKPKKIYGMDVKVFTSRDGKRKYLVFRTHRNSYHVFLEVDAKKAARDCGAKKGKTTRELWRELWFPRS